MGRWTVSQKRIMIYSFILGEIRRLGTANSSGKHNCNGCLFHSVAVKNTELTSELHD